MGFKNMSWTPNIYFWLKSPVNFQKLNICTCWWSCDMTERSKAATDGRWGEIICKLLLPRSRLKLENTWNHSGLLLETGSNIHTCFKKIRLQGLRFRQKRPEGHLYAERGPCRSLYLEAPENSEAPTNFDRALCQIFTASAKRLYTPPPPLAAARTNSPTSQIIFPWNQSEIGKRAEQSLRR